MILALAFLIGCGVLGLFVLNAIQRRPHAAAPFVAFPLIAALLGAPIVFEEGCVDTSVVTGTPETGLTAQYIAWCPERCVNVPDRFTQPLVLPNGFVYDVTLTVDPIAATRLVWDDLPQRARRASWSGEVEAILRTRVEPVFATYLHENETAVLHRNSRNTNDLQATTKELFDALTERGLPFTDL